MIGNTGDSCNREVDRIGVRGGRKPCVATLREKGRNAVREIRRTFSKKTAIEDSKRCNIPAVRKRLKTVRRGIDTTKSFLFHPI